MKKLFLCRHGQTAWNAERRIQGLTDIELDPTGHAQADWLAHFLRRQVSEPARIVTSPLLRAKQTAQHIADALELPVEVDERAIEVNTGIFTAKRLPELQNDLAWQRHLRDPWNEGYGESGEPATSVRDRIMNLIDDAKNDERDLILVTHASPIRHAIMAMLDIPTSHLYHITASNASATLFECRQNFYKCVFINASPAWDASPIE